MENRRKHPRKLMFDMLPVSLTGIGNYIGYLVDITPAGLMLRSTCAVEQGSSYGIRVELREPVDGVDALEIQGECIWCRPAPAMNGFNAGFSFTGSTVASEQLIEALSRPPVPIAHEED